MESYILYLSVALQLLAVVLACSLIGKTKFKVTWFLISASLLLLAIERLVDFVPIHQQIKEMSPELLGRVRGKIWIGFAVSLLCAVGMFFMRRLFLYTHQLETIRTELDQRMMSAVLKAEELERQRFARNLHDGIGPTLSTIKMLTAGLSSSASPESKQEIRDKLNESIEDAIEELSRLSTSISPHVLSHFGLKAALKLAIEKVATSPSLNIIFETDLEDQRFTFEEEVIMYRVAGELLSNTLRHASASEIKIELSLHNNILLLQYIDNGVGFDVEEAEEKGGMGIDNMRSRLRSARGDLMLESNPMEGGMNASAYIHVHIRS